MTVSHLPSPISLPVSAFKPLAYVLGAIAFLGALFYVRAPRPVGGPSEKAPVVLRAPSLPATPPAGSLGEAPAEWALASLSGRVKHLADFRGKVVVLNLWATWCPPCLDEMPSLEALYERLDPDQVAVILLSEESPETVRPFVERHKIRAPVYVDAGPRPPAFGGEVLPATYFIDRAGRVRWTTVGAANWNDDRVLGFIRNLLEEPAG